MARDNMMDLALRITADPSQAEKAVQEFASSVKAQSAAINAASGEESQAVVRGNENIAASQRAVNATAEAMRRTIAQSLQMQGVGAEEAAQVYKQLSINAAQAGAEIKAAYGGAAEAAEAAGSAGASAGRKMAGGMLESLAGLRQFRALMFSTIGIISFGFYISEWARVAGAIREAYHWMEGFDSASKKAFQDLIKGSQEALTNFQGLTVQQKIWQGQQLVAQTQARINADIAARQAVEAQSYWHNLLGLVKSTTEAISGNSVAAATYFAQFAVKSDALKDELEQEALLSKQEKELAKLQKQLQQESARGAKGASEAAKSADALAKALQAVAGAIATAHVQLPPYITEIDRLRAALQHADSGIANTTDLLRQQIELAQRGLPTLRQLGFSINPQEAAAAAGIGGPLLTAAQQAQGVNAPIIRSTKEIQAAMRAQQQAYQRTAQIARESFSIMGESVGQYGGTFGRVFSQVSRIIELMINLHRLESVSAVAAANAKAAGQVAATGKVSMVKSVFETAEGIAALARLDFHAAALHFASSAKFLSVLGIAASVAGAFASAGGGGGSAAVAAAASGGTGSSSQQALPPGPLTPKDNSQGSQPATIQVIFHGDVYGDGGMAEVIRRINAEVEYKRARLVASHTITGNAIR